MAKRQTYGVDSPLKIENPRTDDWHLWRRDSNGDKWMGFFHTADAALQWVRDHPGNFEINNVPPPTSRRYVVQTGTKPVRATDKPQAGRTRRVSPPAAKIKPVRVKPAETAKQRELKAAAKVEYDKRRDAEAADIAAGRTETA